MSASVQPVCRALALGTLFIALGACARDGSGPRFEVDVAALGLADVGDVVWDIEVLNGAATPAVVWRQRVTSTQYGNGAGSVSYVGPCDASEPSHTVRLWLVGLYAAPIAAPGVFAAGSATAIAASPLDVASPTTTAPLVRTVDCVENADTEVRFDVTVMRPARQGFFDIAVAFNDIFCSAKLDCCDDRDGNGCAADHSEDLLLLHDETGTRARTLVMGFACTAGAGQGVVTDLYLDALELDCDVGSDLSTFAPDLTIDPAAPEPGNLCTAGAVAACPSVYAGPGVDADQFLYQVAVFRDVQSQGPAGAQVVSWNTTLGVRPGIAGCHLRVRGTADDAADASDHVSDGTIAAGIVYPVIDWDVDLGTCGSEALSFAPDAPVAITYSAGDGPAIGFAYHFGAGIPAAPFCVPACDAGDVCVAGTCVTPDRVAPDPVALSEPAATPFASSDDSVTISGSCEDGATVVLTGADSVAGTCVGGVFTFTPGHTSDGVYVYSIAQRDAAGNTSTPTTLTWIRDTTTTPAPTITSPASPHVGNVANIVLNGDCTTGARVELVGSRSAAFASELDGVPAEILCSAGGYAFPLTATSDGTRSYTVTQTNLNNGFTSAATTFEWTLDTATPAAVTIDSPSNPFASGFDAVQIGGRCEAGATVTLGGDGTSRSVPCDAGWTFTIARASNGTFVFDIAQVDPAGNTSPSASFSWTRDDTVPSPPVVVSPAPSAWLSSGSALTLIGTCSDDATMTLALGDSGAGAQSMTCVGGQFSFVLGQATDGSQVYTIAATNPRNGSSSAPATFTWTRDSAAPPAPVVTSPTIDPYWSGGSQLALAGTCELGATVALAGADDGTTICAGDGTFLFSIEKSGDATYDFALTQTDAAGNTSASATFSWVRDTTIPAAVQVLDPAVSPVYSAASTLAIDGSCAPGYRVYLQGASTQLLTCASDGTFGFDVAATADGAYPFTLFQEHPNTRAQSSLTSLTWNRDTTAPALVQVVSPAVSPYTSSDDSITIVGVCESGATVALTGAMTTSVPCVEGAFVIPVTRTSNATYNFHLAQTDRAGNASIAILFQWVRDNTIPATPVLTAPTSSPYYAAGTSLTIAGTCTSGLSVKLTGASTAMQSCGGGVFSFQVSPASDGSFDYAIKQQNPSTSISSGAVTLTWVRDNVAPAAVVITSPSVNPYASGDTLFTLSGTCETAASVTLAGAQSGAATCMNGTFQFDIGKSQNGTYDYTLAQRDRAGNTSLPRAFRWQRDASIPPTPVLSSPLVNPYIASGSNLTVAGSCTGTNPVRIRGDAVADATCASGAFSMSITAASDGTYAFQVTQVSAVNGSSSAAVSLIWTRDSAAPAAPSLTSVTPRSPSSDGFPKVFGAAPPDASAINLYQSADCSGAIAATGSPASLASGGLPLAVTRQTTTALSARAIDLAGNASACSSTPLTYTHRAAELVMDINTAGNGDSTPTQLTTIGNKVYFRATNGIVGQELWVSDGTTAGTRMVKDISTIDSSNPSSFGALDGVTYFSATDNEHAAELWRTDGSENGTYMVKDISPGAFGSNPANFLLAGGFLYFTADGGNEGQELWRTDGSATGTSLVKDINPGAAASTPTQLTRVPSVDPASPLIVFRATTASNGTEVWRSDGTDAGTFALEIYSGTSNGDPNYLTAFNGYVYFAGTGTTSGATQPFGTFIGTELFRTDGTLLGTTLVQNINTNGTGGASNSTPAYLTVAGSTLFFSALGPTPSSAGTELWKIGTSGSASLVADIEPGSPSSLPAFITAISDTKVVFRATTVGYGFEPWVSDGSAVGTFRLADINPNAGDSAMVQSVVAGGRAYFSAQTGADVELWSTDGTIAGTQRYDINPGLQSSNPSSLVAFGSSVVFSATNATTGTEPWIADANGAQLLADCNVQPSSTPASFAQLGARALFAADDGVHGRELWVTDGSAAGTRMLADIAATSGASSNPTQLITVGAYVFFRAEDGTNGGEVWRTDGTTAGTQLVTDICPGGTTSNPINFYAFGATLYFSANNCTKGIEPWTITGAGPATLLSDINLNGANSNPANFTAMNGLVYFRAFDNATANELWVTNGTTAGTSMVKDIRPGGNSSSPGGSATLSTAGSIAVVGGKLFFPATTDAAGNELWVSDGTAIGTVLVADIYPGVNSSSPNNIRDVNGIAVFTATTLATGRELFAAAPDGAGGFAVTLLKDIRPGDKNSNPALGLVFGAVSIFNAADETVGNELWLTDGTSAALLVDARPGTGGSVANNFNAIGPSEMWYTANDGINGTEPWRTDLSAGGTYMIQDINPYGPSYGGAAVAVNGVVYFAATDGVRGFELWRY